MSKKYIGALEAGGTKMVCAVGDINGNIIDKVRIPTTTPDETLRCCFDYFLEKNIYALGMASGPAIEERFGEKGELLSERMDVWELESFYIAQAMVNTILMLSPQRIILGGGVMEQRSLFPLIREKTSAFLNGYINTKEISDIDSYIVPASLNGDQGIKGCFKLALDSVKYAE